MTERSLRPEPLEVATGRMWGTAPAAPLVAADVRVTPLEALEQAVVPALEQPPCLVSFSGGRDSSAVLAVAVRAARRHGLTPPIAATVRFTDSPGASEPDWQRLVLEHLGVREHRVVVVTDELDLVGPYGGAALRRHGLLYPSNLGLYALLIEEARGGSLLTGLGGDQVFGSWLCAPLAEIATLRRRPRLADVTLAGFAASPLPLRRAAGHARAARLPWLRPAAVELSRRAAGEAAGGLPRRFDRHLELVRSWRSLAASRWSISLLADDASTATCHPLLDEGFLAALAAHARGRRGGGRTALMESVFAGLLPDAILARGDKAVYHHVYFRGGSRAFARRCSGDGVDQELVDLERVRQAWLSLYPHGASATLLQAAWLASESGQRQEQAARLG